MEIAVISSRASSVIPEVTTASSEVTGLKILPEYGGQDSMYVKQKIRQEEKERRNIQRRRKLPSVDTDLVVFVTMQKESVCCTVMPA